MPASFYFEILGTETYYSHPKKADGFGLDWEVRTEHTAEEYAKAKKRGNGETKTRGRIWQRREIEELQRVDEIICAFMGDPAPSRNRDSEWFYWLHENAFWTMYGNDTGGSEFPLRLLPDLHKRLDETFERIKEKDAALYEERYAALIDRAHGMIDWAMTRKWEFHAHG